MLKKIGMATFLIFLFISCGQQIEEQATMKEVAKIDLDSLLQATANYIGQTVEITGTVTHVCRHGGKKMFLVGQNPEQRIKITTGPAISAFDIQLEGSDITVTGVVEELIVNDAYLDQQEITLQEGGHENDGLDQGTHIDALKNIENLRNQIKESGQDHISFYSIECQSFKELNQKSM